MDLDVEDSHFEKRLTKHFPGPVMAEYRCTIPTYPITKSTIVHNNVPSQATRDSSNCPPCSFTHDLHSSLAFQHSQRLRKF